jgi:hypothetical protein
MTTSWSLLSSSKDSSICHLALRNFNDLLQSAKCGKQTGETRKAAGRVRALIRALVQVVAAAAAAEEATGSGRSAIKQHHGE